MRKKKKKQIKNLLSWHSRRDSSMWIYRHFAKHARGFQLYYTAKSYNFFLLFNYSNSMPVALRVTDTCDKPKSIVPAQTVNLRVVRNLFYTLVVGVDFREIIDTIEKRFFKVSSCEPVHDAYLLIFFFKSPNLLVRTASVREPETRKETKKINNSLTSQTDILCTRSRRVNYTAVIVISLFSRTFRVIFVQSEPCEYLLVPYDCEISRRTTRSNLNQLSIFSEKRSNEKNSNGVKDKICI